MPFHQVIAEESQALGKALPQSDATDLPQFYKAVHNLSDENALQALCLSGGGIRSATFGLGVIQGLARLKLLGQFDYLSTVSGGGYIGGWLTAWIRNTSRQEVLDELVNGSGDAKVPEPRPIRHLRDHSNYLSPKVRAFSADSWTLAATMLRNLILNWLILVPMLAGALLLPRVHVALLTSGVFEGDGLKYGFVLGALLGAFALAQLPGFLPVMRGHTKSESQFRWRHLYPLCGSAILLADCWYKVRDSPPTLAWFLGFGAALHVGGWAAGCLWYRKHPPAWVSLWIILSGPLGGALLWVLATTGFSRLADDAILYATFGPPVLLALVLLAGAIFVGLVSFQEYIQDPDREWYARTGAWVLMVSIGWVLAHVITLLGPVVLLASLQVTAGWMASAGGAASGVFSALLGWTQRTVRSVAANAERVSKFWSVAPQIAEKILAPIFAVTLLSWISLLTSVALNRGWVSYWYEFYYTVLAKPLPGALFAAAALLWFLGYGLGRLLSVNRFSLNHMYRNRLIRAYLGASRKRDPDGFTGFDPADNLLMKSLSAKDRPFDRLFHVINMALNLTSGAELAWQQRQALSFTVSPKHAGSWRLGYRRVAEYTDSGGISLGTSIAISGAAASPNMGSHSSKVLTFLMALFNLRLGAWLPNPASRDQKILAKGGPDSPLVLLDEALGQTDDRSPWVYLSDGGHFENLGLYEMVRRRCRFMVVSDASADPKYDFQDLANAIQKIRADMGVPIEFIGGAPEIRHKKDGPSKHCALLRVQYSVVDGEGVPDGRILYIKPALSTNESRDVKYYSDNHKDFPHETTADQFFSEDQFESYRRLGEQSIEEIAKDWHPSSATVNGLLDWIENGGANILKAATTSTP